MSEKFQVSVLIKANVSQKDFDSVEKEIKGATAAENIIFEHQQKETEISAEF